MTYNVRYFGHALPLRGAAATLTGMARIVDAISRLEQLPHIICLQEVEMRSLRSRLSHTPGVPEETQLEAMMSALNRRLQHRGAQHVYRAFYFPAHAYRVGASALYTTGLAVLAREDVDVDQHNADQPFDITHRPQGRLAKLKQSRVCAHVSVDAGRAGRLEVFNTHLSLPSFRELRFGPGTERMGHGSNQLLEASRLAEFIGSRVGSTPFVVVGDLNSGPGSPVYQLLKKELELRDPFAVDVSLTDLHKAWPTAGFMHLRMRIDHFLMSGHLQCTDVADSHPFGDVHGHWHGLSDHVPILGRVKARV